MKKTIYSAIFILCLSNAVYAQTSILPDNSKQVLETKDTFDKLASCQAYYKIMGDFSQKSNPNKEFPKVITAINQIINDELNFEGQILNISEETIQMDVAKKLVELNQEIYNNGNSIEAFYMLKAKKHYDCATLVQPLVNNIVEQIQKQNKK